MSKLKNINKEADRKTKKLIRLFDGKVPVGDVLEPMDGRKRLKITPHYRTLNDKFLDFIEDKKTGSFIALAITTAAIVAVAYWGIKQ